MLFYGFRPNFNEIGQYLGSIWNPPPPPIHAHSKPLLRCKFKNFRLDCFLKLFYGFRPNFNEIGQYLPHLWGFVPPLLCFSTTVHWTVFFIGSVFPLNMEKKSNMSSVHEISGNQSLATKYEIVEIISVSQRIFLDTVLPRLVRMRTIKLTRFWWKKLLYFLAISWDIWIYEERNLDLKKLWHC